MSEAAKPFAFSQFVPGFDFLKSLTGAAAGGTVPGLPSLSSWVAPTLSVEELEKRINDLKAVQYWLEQNVHALKATIQALEVQKMTLSTLRGMNVRMEDLANAFTRATAGAVATGRDMPKPAPAPAPVAPEPVEAPPQDDAPPADAADTQAPAAGKPAAPGVVDPLQWWNSLTQQFQQIASNALQDAAQLKMPGLSPAGAKRSAAPARKGAASRKPAPPRAAAPARRATPGKKTPARKPAAGRGRGGT